MSDIAEPDDIPTITEQHLANGKRSIQFPEGVPPGTFPIRVVVKDVDGSILSDVVRHGPPQRDGPRTPLTPTDEKRIQEALRSAQEQDPENFPSRLEQLRKMGFPEHLLGTSVRTGEEK